MNFSTPLRMTALAAAAALFVPPAQAVTYAWNNGTYSAALLPLALSAADQLDIGSGTTKTFNVDVSNAGTVNWGADSLRFSCGSAVTNSGSWFIGGDFDMIDGGFGGSLSNSGTLRKTAGLGDAAINGGVGFTNLANGVIDVLSGSLSFDGGPLSFEAGTSFTGAGLARVTSSASFSGAFSATNLQLNVGVFTGTAAKLDSGVVNWKAGTLAGTWEVGAGTTLTMDGSVSKYHDASLTNNGTVVALDHLRFKSGKQLTNEGLFDLQSDDGLIDGGFGGAFLNNGILRKSVAGGTSTISGINTTHNGEINVQTGTLAFTTGTHRFEDGTAFTGAGQVTVGNGATFAGGFTTAGNLSLNGGVYTGGDGSPESKATMNGDMTWTAGEWQGG